MMVAIRALAFGLLAGIALDLAVAYVWLGCMDARDWP